MNSPNWPLAELIELHRSFIEMRQFVFLDDRRNLSLRLVVHRASIVRLEKASVECPCCPVGLQPDLLQEATLFLVESLSAESLRYTDQGSDQFGSWYWNVCCHACQRAARRLQRDASNEIAFVDVEELSHVAAVPQVPEHAIERLSRAIACFPEGPIKNAMLDWTAGLSVDESADFRRMSARSVDRLRQRGRRLVRESCLADAADVD